MRTSALTTSTRRLATVKAVTATSVLVAATLLIGSAPASAAPGDPVVTFISMGGYPQTAAALTSSAVDGTGTTTPLSGDVNTQSFAVSDDGNTVAISGWTGAYAAHNSDATYGTVVTRRDGGTTTTRILSSQYTANPVVSPNGNYVYFLNPVYSAGSKTPTLALYKYDATQITNSANVPVKLALASNFQPVSTSGADPVRLAVSPDGLNVAIVYESFDAGGNAINPSRILAAGITTGKTGNYFEQIENASSTTAVGTSSLVWGDDNSTLAFSTFNTTSGDLSNYSVSVTSSGATTNGGPVADWYDIARYNYAWWMWQDDANNPITTYGNSADPSPLVAPSTTTQWGGNFYVRNFRLSAATPPAITAPVNKPGANADLILNLSSVGYKKTTQYVSYNDYMVTIAGQSFDYNYSETQQGVLEKSIDGKTFTPLLTTTGAHPVSASGYTWTGNLPAVTRTLYYRWHFLGTTLAAGGYSPTSKLTMIPTVTATVKKVGAKRSITGTATRVGGSVTLYKVVGSKATKITTKPISAKGAYTFGTLALKTGNYRISTVADGYAGVGSKTFKV